MLADIEISKDVLLTAIGIVSGYILGLRTSYIIGRIFEYCAFCIKHFLKFGSCLGE